MEWLHEVVATKWREQSKQYAQDMNEFVRIGVETDWSAQQEEPQDERYTFAPQSSYPHYGLFNVERLRSGIMLVISTMERQLQ